MVGRTTRQGKGRTLGTGSGAYGRINGKDGVYLAHENCPTTFTEYNRDHPSMLGAFGLIDSDRIDRTVMDNTLQLVEECWKYPTLWGWDFAMMAMTAVRLGKPEKQ